MSRFDLRRVPASPGAGRDARGETAVARPPVLTVVATAVAVVAAIVQYAAPAVVPVLERGSTWPPLGQPWRWVTPILVQTLGARQVLGNLATLAAVGVVAERLFGRRLWLVLFAVGVLAGQVAAFAQHEPGGGSSIAICGLAGGVCAALLLRRGPLPPLPALVVVTYVVGLTGWGLRGPRTAALAVLLAWFCWFALRRLGRVDVGRVGVLAAVACIAVLAVLGSLHGISLAAGTLTVACRRVVAQRR